MTDQTRSKPSTPECSPCAQLLQEIFQKSDSKPKTLLHSLMTHNNDTTTSNNNNNNAAEFQWKKTATGVQVQIPTAPVTPSKRRWSRLPQPSSDNTISTSNSTNTNNTTLLNRQPTERLATSNNRSSNNRNTSLFFERTPPLTSSSQSPTAVTATSAASQSALQNKTEWLQMSCKECSNTGPEGGARAFVMGPQPLSVVLCTNRLSNTRLTTRTQQLAEMEEILTHELTHVYDVRALQLDLRDCENLAYSEVRAANAAECADVNVNTNTNNSSNNTSSSSIMPAWLQLQQQGSCVRKKALTATRNLFPMVQAQKCLERVFDRAMADTRPFIIAAATSAKKSETSSTEHSAESSFSSSESKSSSS